MSVVIVPPCFDQRPGLQKRIKEFPIKEFISQLSVKRFDIAVFPGTPRFNEERLHSKMIKPLANLFGRKFRAVVRSNGIRYPFGEEEFIEPV